MIRCTLIKIGRNQRGLPIRSEQLVRGDVLRIGRAPECNIHLPDHRVALHHAEIRHGDDGRLFIDATHSAIHINGDFVQGAPLEAGMQILAGPYRLQVEALPQTDALTLSYELLPELDQGSRPASRLALPDLPRWLGPRRLAWTLGLLVLTAFMVLPVSQALWPPLDKQLQIIGVNPHDVWITGELNNAHRRSNVSCMDCHSKPFQAVNNSDCLNCHSATHGHGKQLRTAHMRQDGQACISCHSEHRGMHAAANRSQQECVRCHSDIKNEHAGTTLPDIHDFALGHPDFKLSIRTGVKPEDVRRVLQNPVAAPPRETAPIKFSHEAHLGEVSIPWDTFDTRKLACADCHRPDAAGQRFLAVNFKQDCFYCHQDRFELDPPTEGRKLPHESPELLSHALRDYFAGIALQQGRSAGWVDTTMDKAAQALAGDEGCAYCHVLQPAPDQPLSFRVTPLRQSTQPWFPDARFSHAAHRTAKCESCHKVEHATDSAEIHIPDRQSCLQCHGGSQPARSRVGSSCSSCHGFHNAERLIRK